MDNNDPSCVVTHVFGPTAQNEAGVFLRLADFGEFMVGTWNHVAGVVIVDMLRGANFVDGGEGVTLVDRVRYPCTVLLNPNAEHPANPDWFQRSRVAVLEGDTFRWIRGEPWDDHGLPTGTKIVSRLPGD